MQIEPNQLIELYLDDSTSPEMYNSRVEDVYDDLLVVAAPSAQGVLVPLRVGTKMRIEYKVTTAVKEGRFQNYGVLEKRYEANNVPLLQFCLRGAWQKIQERDFVRVPVLLDALFYPVLDETDEAHTGVILNLSGGGFQLRTTHQFKLYDQIKISFFIDEKQVSSKAKLVRLISREQGIDYGFNFVDLPENYREKIIQYVFQRQIELAEMTRGEWE